MVKKQVFIQMTQAGTLWQQTELSSEHSVSYIYVFCKGYHNYLMGFPGKWCALSFQSTYFGVRLLEFGSASYQQCDLGQMMQSVSVSNFLFIE